MTEGKPKKMKCAECGTVFEENKKMRTLSIEIPDEQKGLKTAEKPLVERLEGLEEYYEHFRMSSETKDFGDGGIAAVQKCKQELEKEREWLDRMITSPSIIEWHRTLIEVRRRLFG